MLGPPTRFVFLRGCMHGPQFSSNDLDVHCMWCHEACTPPPLCPPQPTRTGNPPAASGQFEGRDFPRYLWVIIWTSIAASKCPRHQGAASAYCRRLDHGATCWKKHLGRPIPCSACAGMQLTAPLAANSIAVSAEQAHYALLEGDVRHFPVPAPHMDCDSGRCGAFSTCMRAGGLCISLKIGTALSHP